jgi:hypothetical protein
MCSLISPLQPQRDRAHGTHPRCMQRRGPARSLRVDSLSPASPVGCAGVSCGCGPLPRFHKPCRHSVGIAVEDDIESFRDGDAKRCLGSFAAIRQTHYPFAAAQPHGSSLGQTSLVRLQRRKRLCSNALSMPCSSSTAKVGTFSPGAGRCGFGHCRNCAGCRAGFDRRLTHAKQLPLGKADAQLCVDIVQAPMTEVAAQRF